MHIELTDHLRCPEEHDEAFLVLIPDRMEGRRVIAGHLGCPVCGWSTDWDDGVPIFGEPPAAGEGVPPFDADAALAMLAIEGPGGWIALGGRAGILSEELTARLPDVGIVAVNPPADVMPVGAINVLRASRWPLKRHAMRAVVLGADVDAPESAVASALPGLRVVGEGAPPSLGPGDELIAEVPGIWVLRHR